MIASVQTSADTAPMSAGVFVVVFAAAVILTIVALGFTRILAWLDRNLYDGEDET